MSPILHWGAAALDIAIAWYLSQHVLDGYKFLMQNYEVGDKVCLIGEYTFLNNEFCGLAYEFEAFPEARIPREH